MSAERPIRLHDIRAHEGSQARAWEELTYQLREDPSDPSAEVRKTRAPDGGVEWYYVFADGHEEGFQAKFNPNLAAALGGMRESVEAVAAKRPSMTRLTFLVPYDFTDSGTSTTKSDQDRWNDAVASWHKIPGAADIEFAVARGGDVLDELTRDRHAGRRSYWFGGTELTSDWLERRWEESRDLAGVRYTPEADTSTALTRVLDGVVLAPSFTESVRSAVARTIARCRRDEGMWEPASIPVGAHIATLQAWMERSLEQEDPDGRVDLPTVEWDLTPVAAAAAGLAALGARAAEHAGKRHNDDLNRAMDAVESLAALSSAEVAHLSQERMAAVVGTAGQGKTHALMVLCRRLLDDDVPAVVVLGSRLGDSTWWDAVSGALGGLRGTSDEFLQAMDSQAQARGRRGVILIDALNETQSPRRWRAELRTLATQVKRYSNLALIVSFRSDWESVVMEAGTMSTFEHPGLAGHESEALSRYCALFEIPEPAVSPLDPAFSSPLFLRMFCEVLQQEQPGRPLPTRSDLFDRFARVRTRHVIDRLEVAPTTTVVGEAMLVVTDELIARAGLAAPRAQVEPAIDALLPGRPWPNTLFGAMASEGLIEVGPTFDGTEAVSLPFQSYSEHILAGRFLETSFSAGPPHEKASSSVGEVRKPDAQAIKDRVWLWRALAVLLPEQYDIEITDVLHDLAPGAQSYLNALIAESFTDRKLHAFTPRTLELVEAALRRGPTAAEAEAILAMAVRPGHPAEAAWLHQLLTSIPMPDRDACWSTSTYYADSQSSTYRRLVAWAIDSRDGSEPETGSVATVFAWLLTSPNRFLRDEISKALVQLLCRRLDLMASLVRDISDIDDPYVIQRVFLAAYGAVMVGGDNDLNGAREVIDELLAWETRGLPVDVLARDSARGAAAWATAAGIMQASDASRLAPPYGAERPTEPPTAADLEREHGAVWGTNHNLIEQRAASILSSCLTWMGDFNKYVVKSDVATFTRAPLNGPPPTLTRRRGLPEMALPPAAQTTSPKILEWVRLQWRAIRSKRTQGAPAVEAGKTAILDNDVNAEIDADWAGRWIANRAIKLGWTSDRFAEFEENISSQNRDAHKPERFGKKYQWIAHHELLARLADNYHLAPDRWSNTQGTYHGPWVWHGRDLDPTLPPSRNIDGARVCQVARTDQTWAALTSNPLGSGLDAAEWVFDDADLPEAERLFEVTDPNAERWIVLERYASWSRNDSRRRSMSKRTRDLFFLQFAWLVPAGQGRAVVDHLTSARLAGRWMPDPAHSTQQYLGEGPWSVIESTTPIEPDVPFRLAESGLTVRGALTNYLWESSTHDCSIDVPVNIYRPSSELLGPARWVPYQAAWRSPSSNEAGSIGTSGQVSHATGPDTSMLNPADVDAISDSAETDDNQVVVKALEIQEDLYEQTAVVVNDNWLIDRLRTIDADLVIGTLGEKTAVPRAEEGATDDSPIWTDITYLSLIQTDGTREHSGPIVRRRSPADEVDEG